MRAWRRRLGWFLLVLVVFGSGFLGARLGLVSVPVAQASHNFGDVPDTAFYHAFVQFLVDFGITGGCGPGQFCGEAPVTRGQMAVFLKKLADVVPVCPPDSVKVGTTCIDKYEASVWEVPAGSVALIQKIKAGTVTLAELQAGAVQKGVASDDYGAGCPDNGNGCKNFYAVSLAGVPPSASLTWFQAAAGAERGEAVADERGMAGGGAGDAGSGRDSRSPGLQYQQWRTEPDRLPSELCLGRGDVRHGGEPLRMGGRLGAAVRGCLPWVGDV